ncbi:MFS transporter [Iamia sp. SCSIO 61187]|uniref:MFS transporter n=1 Tax=Iamia sp. SCSIO 61187 TaxID=2722752 RepID=UPI001C62D818|nr:MFS transporter [Iamia sp. SCSIO 61187]QYG92175.1 MFS transporter [Iamia sp. SCSIO 61187]
MGRRALLSSPVVVQAVVFGAFAAPIGMLGAAWPEGRLRVDRPAAALGLLVTGYGLGRLSTSATALAILRRVSIGPATATVCVGLAGAQVVMATTRSFAVLGVAATAVGLASGTLDSLGNRYQTAVRDVRQAGLVFGAYGVGATAFPALVGITSWPVGFLAGAGAALAAAALALSPAVRWPAALAEHRGPAVAHPTAGPAVRAAAAWSLAAFALFCTVEIVTGNWAATYLEDGRGVSGRSAAFAVSGFWGGITVGRLLLGRARLGPRPLLVGAGSVAAALIVALPLVPGVIALGTLPLVGLALAPLFPTLMATTADRVGPEHAGRLGGYQLVAMNLGGTGLSALVGVAVGAWDARAVGWLAAGLALVGLPLLLRTARLVPAGRPAPRSHPVPAGRRPA